MREVAAFLVLVGLALSGPARGSGDRLCDGLGEVLAAADAGDGFSRIRGADAGLYHETTLVLPGAQVCGLAPHERPDAAWRCQLSSRTKYIQALARHGEMLGRVEGCLGADWSAERLADESYLRADEYRKQGSPVRLRVLTTKGSKHRLILAVYSPVRDPAAPPAPSSRAR